MDRRNIYKFQNCQSLGMYRNYREIGNEECQGVKVGDKIRDKLVLDLICKNCFF